jgi:hypothetical protein
LEEGDTDCHHHPDGYRHHDRYGIVYRLTAIRVN